MTTPLGLPVEPEVNMMYAVLEGSTFGSEDGEYGDVVVISSTTLILMRLWVLGLSL